MNTEDVNAYLSHDIALSLDVSKAKKRIPYSWVSLLARSFILAVLKKKKTPYLPVSKGAKVIKNVAKYYLKNSHINNKGVLNAYRTDTESTELKLPDDNVDISEVYKLGTNENLSLVSSVGLLKFIENFDVINTNRLHGCIAGILMNKKVNFYPNSYFKNRAVYNHSIKGVYENVNWMGQS